MIDLNELEAAINRCAFDGDVLSLSKAECRDLLTRLRQAEKGAARYLHLKVTIDAECKSLLSYSHELRGKYWDDDIDSDIEEEKEENGSNN